MSSTEFLTMLHKRPFEPFHIEVSDGTSYDIRHPEMVIPTMRAAHIGIPTAKKGGGYEHVEIVSMEHIVKLLPLPAAAASA
jgi:hypothetical protein